VIEIGGKIPDFTLRDQNGKTVTSADWEGKKIVLFAFPRADTPGCTIQACGFRDEMETFSAANALIYGISPDSPERLARWRAKKSFQYDFLSDPDHELLEALGGWGEKSMYGKKYMGVVRSHWIFDEDGTALDVQIKVSPKVSVERATAFLATD
jgi:peroxiredoxin Q/BCP